MVDKWEHLLVGKWDHLLVEKWDQMTQLDQRLANKLVGKWA